jgi:plastocyanin
MLCNNRRAFTGCGWGAAAVLLAGFLLAPALSAQTLRIEVVDEQGRPVEGAVVSLESAAAKRAVRPLAGLAIVQKGRAFVPAVTAIPRGTTVAFPNEDTVRHHVYSFSPPKRFELKLYIGTPAAPVVFDQPGVVVLGCNIHDHMVAWVVVLDTPYYTLSSAQGLALLLGAPAGEYQVAVWHPRLPVNAPAQLQALAVHGRDQAARLTLKALGPP